MITICEAFQRVSFALIIITCVLFAVDRWKQFPGTILNFSTFLIAAITISLVAVSSVLTVAFVNTAKIKYPSPSIHLIKYGNNEEALAVRAAKFTNSFIVTDLDTIAAFKENPRFVHVKEVLKSGIYINDFTSTTVAVVDKNIPVEFKRFVFAPQLTPIFAQ